MRARFFLASLLGFLSLLAMTMAVPAAAQPRDGIQPLDRLLPGIRRDHPGTFYDAEGPTYGPNPHYHLKWMTPEGRVIWYDADARSGRVLRSSPGRDNFDSGDRAAPRPFADRYPPYMAEPYDRGYGRMREQERYANPPPGFGHGPRYGNPYGGWRRDGGGRGGRGRR
ncbi:MAG TPA: hypothetical protein VGM26_18510 [Rhizomicrobium sp.]|jgi:hypothetical protein